MMFLVIFFLSIFINLEAKLSSEFSTFWGGMRRAIYWDNNQKDKTLFKFEQFSEAIPIYLNEKKEKAALLIYYPGIFAEIDSKIIPYMIDELEKLNAHLLVLPSFLADDFLKYKPQVQGDPWDHEAKLQVQMINEIKNKIGEEKIEDIYVFTESLGVWQSMLLISQEKIKIKKLVIAWPALDLNQSIRLFDQKIADTLADYQNCQYWPRLFFSLYKYKNNNPWNEINKEDEVCLGAFAIQDTFVKRLQSVAAEVALYHKLKFPHPPKNFTEFIKFVTPDLYPLIQQYNPKLTIYHWLPTIEKQNIPVEMIAAKDDFINSPLNWNEYKNHNYLHKGVQLYDWGGHCGQMASPEFWDYFNKQFNNLLAQ